MERNPNGTARKIAEKAFTSLAGELQAGRSEALTSYLDAMSRFRNYSWDNALLIAAQRPEATQVAGIHAWNDLGRAVKAGEKGILIFAPDSAQEKLLRDQPLLKDASFQFGRPRATYVFDLSQTEGKPLPQSAHPTVDPGQSAEQLKALIGKRGIDETQAQAVAYVVARGLGVGTDSPPADYSTLYSGDPKTLARSLATIQETAAQILDELLPEKRTPSEPFPATSAPERTLRLDTEGFGQIHRAYRDRLVESMAGFVKDRDKAEDIAAWAFERAWQKRENFRGDASPYTYVQAIARNEALGSIQRDRRVKFEPLDDAEVAELGQAELVTDELEKQEDRFRLKHALHRLPAKLRRALVAQVVEGLSIREIARRERVPSGTVLSRIHRGKQLLREAWQRPMIAPHADVMTRETPSPKPQDRHGSQAPRPIREQHPTPDSPEPATWDR